MKMANMSYCRFSNTVADLNDCHEHLGDGDLSLEENKARRRLVRLCKLIADDADNLDLSDAA